MIVSIIITSYNYGKYLERCIRSCLDQYLPGGEFEIIVVDDHSSDETPEILKKYEGTHNFRYRINEQNLGVASSANEGIRMARGQFVVRVDADDYVSRYFIFHLWEYIKVNLDAFCVACDYLYIDEHEKKLERVYANEKPISCGIMYRKDLLIHHGMYNDEWRHREEEELRKRLGNYYKIHHLHMPLYRYRIHKNNKTNNLDMLELFKQRLVEVQSKDIGHINVEEIENREDLLSYVVAVIPARGGSQRLPRKNIYPLWGKPMLCWVVEAAQKSKYVHDVFVSTEDDEIAAVAQQCGAKVIQRPHKLAEHNVYKQDVICHAVQEIERQYRKPTIVISMQANSPQLQTNHIDEGVGKLIHEGLQEVVSVGTNLIQNSALRIMTMKTVFQKTLSTHFGVFVADLLDVHTLDDVNELEKQRRA